jgi:16S rRNA (uracil1498-N3)-methyltransferase
MPFHQVFIVIMLIIAGRLTHSLYVQQAFKRRFTLHNIPRNKEETKLPRIYLKNVKLQSQNTGILDENDTNYVKNVMRLKDGEQIRVFNEINGEYLARLSFDGKKKHPIVTITMETCLREPESFLNRRKIHLYFAPIKKERMKLMFEKCTELGVDSFQPVITQNTNVDSEQLSSMYESLEKIIVQSVEQSEQIRIPTFHSKPPSDFSGLLSYFNSIDKRKHLLLVCRERYYGESIVHVLSKLSSSTESISVFVGPEGGFTQVELESLSSAAQFVSLGNTVLRSETASIAAIANIVPWLINEKNSLNLD